MPRADGQSSNRYRRIARACARVYRVVYMEKKKKWGYYLFSPPTPAHSLYRSSMVRARDRVRVCARAMSPYSIFFFFPSKYSVRHRNSIIDNNRLDDFVSSIFSSRHLPYTSVRIFTSVISLQSDTYGSSSAVLSRVRCSAVRVNAAGGKPFFFFFSLYVAAQACVVVSIHRTMRARRNRTVRSQKRLRARGDDAFRFLTPHDEYSRKEEDKKKKKKHF